MSAVTLSGGHQASVLCVDVQPSTGQVASGSEEGDLCLWSSAGELINKYTRPETDCTSVLFSRLKPTTLYVAFGANVLIFDTDHPQEPKHSFQCNLDEVNQVQVDEKEEFIAACDDAGEIKILGISELKVYKTLRFKHTNICSTVLFRLGRPWEVISGGLDCRMVHWDFSKPKCLNQFNMQELHATSNDDTGYMVNPPFIHHLAMNKTRSLIACALENGLVAVFDSTAKNLKEKFCLHAHEQGVSQVHFSSENTLISGGNDCRIIVWDLSKAEENQANEGFCLNGDSSVEDRRNESITELCKAHTLVHPFKVNWLAPFMREGRLHVAIADQTSNITIKPLSAS
ncbi:hypothetical protein BaRGS_00022266 [Batillaria attramentaria]|uniref:Uncharacterized protein n=1 Tax=Batillaria attramentaria TaxID=370345 RepID=A0ABD0KH03_9CAEN